MSDVVPAQGIMMRYITIAIAKGRLAEFATDVFCSVGLDCQSMMEKNRKLIFTDEKNGFKFVLVKAADVPTYVEYGAADIGIVGKDTLLEEGRSLYEMIDLKFGACSMVVAGPPHMADLMDKINNKRVATKYPNIAKNYFEIEKKQDIEIIKLSGSVELAPLVNLSEVIVDIVESGSTLKQNGLVVLEKICDISACLVVNRVSIKIERERIVDIVEKIKNHINRR